MSDEFTIHRLMAGVSLLASGSPHPYELLGNLLTVARELARQGFDADALAYLLLNGAMDAGMTEFEALRLIRSGLEVTDA